jgi:hypothetical protein
MGQTGNPFGRRPAAAATSVPAARSRRATSHPSRPDGPGPTIRTSRGLRAAARAAGSEQGGRGLGPVLVRVGDQHRRGAAARRLGGHR